MGSKDRFNPIQTLSAIMDRHEGTIDADTMQSYLSFISFISLLNIYQNMTPQVANTGFSNADLSGMLNKFMGGKANIDQSSISSLLSSIPPDAIEKVGSMLGGAGGGAPRKSGFPLGGLMSMVAKNPGILSMLGSGLGSGGLGSLLGGGSGAGAGALGSLLGGAGGTGGLASLLGGVGGKGGAGALNGLLGAGGSKGLGALGALGGLQGLAAFAPMLPYVGSFGKKFTRNLGKKMSRKKRSKSGNIQEADVQKLTDILSKSETHSHLAPLIPQLAALANTDDLNTALPVLLPLMAKNSKRIKKNLKTGLKPIASSLKPVAKAVAMKPKSPTKAQTSTKQHAVINQPVITPQQASNTDFPIKAEPVKTINQSTFPLKNTVPVKVEKISSIQIPSKNLK